jgi:hypothetical protein
LSLEILEDRLPLSTLAASVHTWSAPPPPWQAAVAANHGGQSGNDANSYSDTSQSKGVNDPSEHSSAGATSSSQQLASTNLDGRAAANYYSAASSGGSGTVSGGITETAYTYYGQQPFYRNPADASGASRFTGREMPEPSTEGEVLASLTASEQENAAVIARSTATTLETASRRNMAAPSPLVRLTGGLAAAEIQPLLVDDLTQPQTGPGTVLAAGPDVVALLVRNPGSPVLGVLPGTGHLAVGMLPVDVAALERGVAQFFSQVGALGDHVTDLEAARRLAPWLVAVALSTAALETARWRFWKPAPCQPVLTGLTRAAAAGPPSGSDLPPADAS